MSSTTTNLGLVKMASGETIGQWSDANNGSGQNLDKIDTAIGTLNSQLANATKRKAFYNTSTSGVSINGIKFDIQNTAYIWFNAIVTTRFGIHTVFAQTNASGGINVRIHRIDAFEDEVLSSSIDGRTVKITSSTTWNQFCVEGSTNLADISSLNFGEIVGT